MLKKVAGYVREFSKGEECFLPLRADVEGVLVLREQRFMATVTRTFVDQHYCSVRVREVGGVDVLSKRYEMNYNN